MNAQYILFAMNASNITQGNTLSQASLNSNQREVLDFKWKREFKWYEFKKYWLWR